MSHEKTRKYDRPDHKGHYAAYLNLARQNFFITVKDIQERRIGPWAGQDDATLASTPLFVKDSDGMCRNISPQVIKDLTFHFPYLEPLAQDRISYRNYKNSQSSGDNKDEKHPTPEDYVEVLLDLYRWLQHWRNQYSHYDRPTTSDGRLLSIRTLGKWLFRLYHQSLKNTKQRFVDVPEDTFRALDPYDNRGNRRKNGFHHHLMTDDEKISEKGLAFFICLFLPPAESTLFLKRLYGFRDSRDEAKKNTLRLYQYYHIRTPRPRLQSDHTIQALLLDMVNDLVRCPRPLFERLREEEKDIFRLSADDDSGELEREQLHDSVTRHLLRSTDRIDYFARRYLDYAEVMHRLRFQYKVGKFTYDSYTRPILNEDVEVNKTVMMRVAGRLQDVYRSYPPDAWHSLMYRPTIDSDAPPKHHIRYMEPSHRTWSSNVLLQQVDHTADRVVWPVIASQSDGVSYHEPTLPAAGYILSDREVRALCLYHLMRGDVRRLENRLLGYISSIQKLYQDIRDDKVSPIADQYIPNTKSAYASRDDRVQYHEKIERRYEALDELLADRQIRRADLPERVLHYLIGIKSGHGMASVERQLRQLLQRAKQQKKKYDNLKKNRQADAKEGIYRNRAGELGDAIAEKLLYYQPADPSLKNNGKANEKQYAVLQMHLAFFGRDREILPDLLRELHLLDSTNAHPYLKIGHVKDSRSVADLYEKVISAEIRYLEHILKNPKQWSSLGYVRIRKPIDKESLTAYLLDPTRPYPLPKNYILRACRELLLDTAKKNSWTDVADELDGHPHHGLGQLIHLYYRARYGDDHPAYYDYPRRYESIDILVYDRDRRSRRLGPVYRSREEYRSAIQAMKKKNEDYQRLVNNLKKKNKSGIKEAQVRAKADAMLRRDYDAIGRIDRWEAHDILLYMMSMDILEKTNKGWRPPKYGLRDICQDSQLLSQEIDVQVDIPGTDSIQLVETLRIKKYGNLRGLARDRRLQRLARYYHSSTLSADMVRRELQQYQILRAEIYQSAIDLEGVLIEHGIAAADLSFGASIKALVESHPSLCSDETKRHLIAIRSAIAHNEYPDYDEVRSLLDERADSADQSYAGTLLTYFQETVERLIAEL